MTRAARFAMGCRSISVFLWRRPFLLLLAILAPVALALAADWWICLPPGETSHYVGHADCVRCHQKQEQLWTGSDHQRAMAEATPKTVLGNFDGQEFSSDGATSKFSHRGEQFFVTTDGPTGTTEKFPVKYTFGVYPLQQYLVQFPDGRIQCLRAAWDVPGKRWFHLYPDEQIPAGDELHWTRPLQNWNYMCADCHTTNLRKNYDVESNTYHTEWTELGVACEDCHGPGSLHVKIADSRRLFWDRRYGYGLPHLKSPDSHVQIETCAPCHARRRLVYPGFRPGEKFLDFYVPEMLDSDCYYPDGQIRDEDFEYSSFLQSKMYANQVRCSDCHDPHTTRVKFTDPKTTRPEITDNRLCGQCHVPTKYDTPQHHHHPNASQPGTLCIECHMPETTYMVVDRRRDHSFRVPRPDLTQNLQIPNACNGCHQDQAKGETPEWAADQVQQWYGKRNEPPSFAYAIAAGREGKPDGEKLLEAVTRRQDLSGIVRASAILLLGRYATETSRAAAYRSLADPDGLIRVAAVRSLQEASAEELLRHVTPLVHDPLRAVRTEAARLLAGVPTDAFSVSDREAFDRALAEYITGLEYLGDNAGAHASLALVYEKRGDNAAAEREYRIAVRLEPQSVQSHVNLAMFCGTHQERREAIAEFRRAIELLDSQHEAIVQRQGEVKALEEKLARTEPQSLAQSDIQQRLAMARTRTHELANAEQLTGQVHFSLGLLLAEEEKDLAAAVEQFALAARWAPENPRIAYNYGLALQKLGRPDEAEKWLATAYKLAPGVPDYLRALTILYLQQKRWSHALACAKDLVERMPDDPSARALLEHVEREAAAGKTPEK
jgi:Flp pilus assembly protein TadD